MSKRLDEIIEMRGRGKYTIDHGDWLISRVERLELLLNETVGMWLKHGSFYSVSDHEAWLEKAHKVLEEP